MDLPAQQNGNSLKEKLKELLGLNLPNLVIVSAVGCSEEDITDAMADEVFREEVMKLRVKNLAENAQRDNKLNKLEDRIIEKLEELFESGMLINKPMELVRMLGIVNAAKRRGTGPENTNVAPRPTVPLVMPVTIAAKFTVNVQNQVTSVEGRTVATMPASAVVKQLEEKRNRQDSGENQKHHEEDAKNAVARLKGLVTMEEGIPVHQLL